MGFTGWFFFAGGASLITISGATPNLLPTTVPAATTGRTTADLITTVTLPEGMFSNGKCPDYGLCNAQSVDECDSLATIAGLGLTVSKSFHRTDRPAGCFVTPDETLKYNTFADSVVDANKNTIVCKECPSSTSAPSTISQISVSTHHPTTDTSTPYQTTTDEYRLVGSGVCSDAPGYCTIEDKDLCETAAAALGVDSVISGNPIHRLDRAPGCWLTRSGSLKLNEAFESATHANGQTNVCILCPSTLAFTSVPTPDSTAEETTEVGTAYASGVGGLCSDLGDFCHIESVEECEVAAADLGFADTIVNSFIDLLTRPPGCWLTSSGNLKMNNAFDSTSAASGSQTNLCVQCEPTPVTTIQETTAPDSTTDEITVSELTTEVVGSYVSFVGGT
jgi:hypothetical protein